VNSSAPVARTIACHTLIPCRGDDGGLCLTR
jgi:hypothetical protein